VRNRESENREHVGWFWAKRDTFEGCLWQFPRIHYCSEADRCKDRF